MSAFLTAEWRKLVMAQYVVAPQTLADYLPNGLELDLYQERCFVSLVGFLFAGLNGVEPESVLLAEGSAVSVDSGSRLMLG